MDRVQNTKSEKFGGTVTLIKEAKDALEEAFQLASQNPDCCDIREYLAIAQEALSEIKTANFKNKTKDREENIIIESSPEGNEIQAMGMKHGMTISLVEKDGDPISIIEIKIEDGFMKVYGRSAVSNRTDEITGGSLPSPFDKESIMVHPLQKQAFDDAIDELEELGCDKYEVFQEMWHEGDQANRWGVFVDGYFYDILQLVQVLPMLEEHLDHVDAANMIAFIAYAIRSRRHCIILDAPTTIEICQNAPTDTMHIHDDPPELREHKTTPQRPHTIRDRMRTHGVG